MSNIGKGTAGTILQGNGTSSGPKFSTATYPSTAGSSGKILISDGTNIVSSTPTYPNSATGTGKILRADGTNWVASTATFPDTAGTSGNVLTSDGTNWTSSAPTSGSSGGTFVMQCAQGSPADATTYYLATAVTLTGNTTTNVAGRFYCPVAGTINKVYGTVGIGGATGTSENTTIALRKNDTTNSNVTTTLQLTAAINNFNNTSLGLTVVAGDFIEVLLICPTWVTNPTIVKVTVCFTLS